MTVIRVYDMAKGVVHKPVADVDLGTVLKVMKFISELFIYFLPFALFYVWLYLLFNSVFYYLVFTSHHITYFLLFSFICYLYLWNLNLWWWTDDCIYQDWVWFYFMIWFTLFVYVFFLGVDSFFVIIIDWSVKIIGV